VRAVLWEAHDDAGLVGSYYRGGVGVQDYKKGRNRKKGPREQFLGRGRVDTRKPAHPLRETLGEMSSGGKRNRQLKDALEGIDGDALGGPEKKGTTGKHCQ